MTVTAPAAEARPTVVASAPAKTNLGLHVGSPTPDGYHPLESLFLAVDLRETVTATLDPSLARRGAGVSVSVEPAPGSAYERMVEEGTARLSDIPLDGANLAVRAALAVCGAYGVPAPGLHLHVQKAVPVAGGMGGGSADAAAALVAVNELLASHTGLPRLSAEELHRLGADLGADVPFMLLGGAAIGRGTGTELTPVPAPTAVHVVFVPQDQGLSTPAVYRQWDAAHTVVNAAAPASGETVAAQRATGTADPEHRWEKTATLAPYTEPDPSQTARLAPVAQEVPETPGAPVAPAPDAPVPLPEGVPGSAPERDGAPASRPSVTTGLAPDPISEDLLDALAHGDTTRLAALVRNDLQAPAIHLLPELETLLDHGVDLGAVVGWVSGSGPTVCFLARSAVDAEALVAAFERERRRALAVSAPVPGARIEATNHLGA